MAWDGVGDAAGEAVEPSPERVDLLLDHWPAFDAFDRLYVGPALAQDAEKKRLTALARWHFEGGEGYCAGLPGAMRRLPL